MDKLVVKVAEERRDEIQDLFEKMGAFENLIKIIDPEENRKMYQQIIKDYGTARRLFQEWWDRIKLENGLGDANYYINFETCEILEKEE